MPQISSWADIQSLVRQLKYRSTTCELSIQLCVWVVWRRTLEVVWHRDTNGRACPRRCNSDYREQVSGPETAPLCAELLNMSSLRMVCGVRHAIPMGRLYQAREYALQLIGARLHLPGECVLSLALQDNSFNLTINDRVHEGNDSTAV